MPVRRQHRDGRPDPWPDREPDGMPAGQAAAPAAAAAVEAPVPDAGCAVATTGGARHDVRDAAGDQGSLAAQLMPVEHAAAEAARSGAAARPAAAADVRAITVRPLRRDDDNEAVRAMWIGGYASYATHPCNEPPAAAAAGGWLQPSPTTLPIRCDRVLR